MKNRTTKRSSVTVKNLYMENTNTESDYLDPCVAVSAFSSGTPRTRDNRIEPLLASGRIGVYTVEQYRALKGARLCQMLTRPSFVGG